ncbi:putative CAS1 domain-containing protein 1 [Hypsibius exemplaris]|uniref:CAS1 domain-containing protein 1 n=1 Tax=Hypsibius exemplaris TaxID=2072580 RepID=A0A1W0WCI1_HYPEX|nr:putative CAS1 domain-containing protein 1 [Hypsibius exemplaris]
MWLLYLRHDWDVTTGSRDNPCGSLMSSGSFIGQEAGQVWRPDDCQMRIYSRQDLNFCMQTIKRSRNGNEANVVFAGDSRIRQLRDALFYELTGNDRDWLSNKNVTHIPSAYAKHSNNELLLRDSGVRIEFIWAAGLGDWNGKAAASLRKLAWRDAQRRPNLLVLGSGAWAIWECEKQNRSQSHCVSEYKKTFKLLLPTLTEIAKHTHVIWAPQLMVNESVWISTGRAFTNQNMKIYNNAIITVLDSTSNHGVIYWKSMQTISSLLNDSLDGLHFGPRAKYYDTQMLLNLLCNSVSGSFNNFGDNNCCTGSTS